MSNCFLCGSEKADIIHRGVRDNPEINVLKCKNCGLVRLSKFIADTEDYYSSSKMRIGDVENNLKEIRVTAAVDDERRYKFISRMIENKTYLDFGCGAGGILKLAQNKARRVFGVELEKAMCDVLEKEGIKCYASVSQALKDLKGKMNVVSLFHVLEHLENPIDYLQELKSLLSEGGKIIIEVPNADDALLSLYESDEFANFTYWESHLYLYNNTTFSELMKQAGLKIQFLGQIQRYPLSNTFYWLAKGKPGGHKEWAMLSNEKLDAEYESQLAKLGIADTIMAVVKK